MNEWFHNARNEKPQYRTGVKKAPAARLLKIGHRRMPTADQAYRKLHPEEVNNILNEEYKTYIKNLASDEKPLGYLAWTNRRAAELLHEADPETQSEVLAFQQSQSAGAMRESVLGLRLSNSHSTSSPGLSSKDGTQAFSVETLKAFAS